MGLKILFMTSWSELDINTKSNWARELQRRGHDSTVVTLSSRGTRLAKQYISDVVELSLPDLTTMGPDEIEQQYGIPSFRQLYFTEEQYFALEQQTAKERALRIVPAIQKLFRNRSFDVVYQGRGGETHRLVTYYIADQRDILHVWGEFSAFDNSLAFGTGLDGLWANYETIEHSEISPSERQNVSRYIEQFRDQKRFYSHDNNESSTVQSILNNLKSGFLDETPTDLSKAAVRKCRKAVNRRLNRPLLPSLEASRQKCLDTEYVFFPLQWPPESRLTVFSPQYFNQHATVEYLSRILPSEVTLFVKQHPNHPGEQSPLWIERLRQEGKVEFLHPEHSVHHIAKHAETVIVTNNTVGFETLFYDTPLVVLGKAFYMDTPAATKVTDDGMLSRILTQSIDRTTDDATAISSVHSLRKAAYKVEGSVLSDQRARASAGAILDFVQDY